jgi:hypothetical protein
MSQGPPGKPGGPFCISGTARRVGPPAVLGSNTPNRVIRRHDILILRIGDLDSRSSVREGCARRQCEGIAARGAPGARGSLSDNRRVMTRVPWQAPETNRRTRDLARATRAAPIPPWRSGLRARLKPERFWFNSSGRDDGLQELAPKVGELVVRRNRRPLRVSERCSKEPKAATSVGAVLEGTEGRFECRSGARRNRRLLRMSERCLKEPKAASNVGALLEGTEGRFECRSAA